MASLSKNNTREEIELYFKDAELFTSLRYDPLLASADEDASIKMQNVMGDDGLISSSPRTLSPFYMLDYHRSRILQAATFLQWTAVEEALPNATVMESLITQDMNSHNISRTAAKIRFAITQDAKISIIYMTLPIIPLDSLFPTTLSLIKPPASSSTTPSAKVFLDTQPTPTGPATTFKTSKRSMYESARARFADLLPPGLGGEVLIVDEKGEVLEGTLTSVYFFRGGRWVTPLVGAGPGEWKGQMGTTRRWALEKGLCVEEVVRSDSVIVGENVWLSNGARGFWVGKVERAL